MHELIIKFAYFVLFLAGLLFCNQQNLKSEELSPYGNEEFASSSYVISQQAQKIEDLEYELRQLTGRLQVMEHRLRQMQDYMSVFVEKTENRLFSMEDLAQKQQLNSSNLLTKNTSSPVQNYETDATSGKIVTEEKNMVALDPNTPLSVKQQYEFARSFLLSSDYEAAEKALRKFIEINGSHSLTGNALYWLGETYYVRNIYDEAAKTFATGYRTFPKGNKAPDSLLKLSMSFHAMNQKEKACDTLGQLIKEFPKSNPSIIRHATKARQNYRCP